MLKILLIKNACGTQKRQKQVIGSKGSRGQVLGPHGDIGLAIRWDRLSRNAKIIIKPV